MSQQSNLGEQAIDKVAELAINSQLEQTDQLDVAVKTDPVKLIQGKVDSVKVAAEGMVVKPDLRAAAVGIEADAVAIDPLKVMLGEIVLTETLNANAHVLLTETDLNQALASDFLRRKMQDLRLDVQGTPTRMQIEQIVLTVPDDQFLLLDAVLTLIGLDQQNLDQPHPAQPHPAQPTLDQQTLEQHKQFSAVVKPFLSQDGYCLNLELVSAEGQGLNLDFIRALLDQVAMLLDLRNFGLSNMTFRLKEIRLQPGQILLRGGTQIEPGSLNELSNT